MKEESGEQYEAPWCRVYVVYSHVVCVCVCAREGACVCVRPWVCVCVCGATPGVTRLSTRPRVQCAWFHCSRVYWLQWGCLARKEIAGQSDRGSPLDREYRDRTILGEHAVTVEGACMRGHEQDHSRVLERRQRQMERERARNNERVF